MATNLQNTPRTRASLRRMDGVSQEKTNHRNHGTEPAGLEEQTFPSESALSLLDSTAPQLCPTCKHDVSSNDSALQCDVCNYWEHLTCSSVRKTLYSCLKNSAADQMLYICSRCNNLRKKGQRLLLLPSKTLPPATSTSTTCATPSEPASLQNGLSTTGNSASFNRLTCHAASDESDSDSTVIDVSEKPHPKRRRRKRSKNKGLPEQAPTVGVPAHQEDDWITIGRGKSADAEVIKKIDRLPPRDQCVMLFRIPESVAATPSARYDDDINQLAAVVNKLFDPGEEGITVKRAIRIGKRSENTEHPRPLKLVLNTRTEAQTLLSRRHRLTGTAWSLRPDLSPQEREQQRAAVQLLRERQAKGETNLIIRNFQVVRKKLYKKPVTLRPEL